MVDRLYTLDISTHALTWSATPRPPPRARRATISTHALTWSATRRDAHRRRAALHFNSRAHVERDHHAHHPEREELQFQLTRSRGARPPWASGLRRYVDFNSRAHVERDAAYNKGTTITINFNSRAHVERDLMKYKSVSKIVISTHALTWSATFRNITAG